MKKFTLRYEECLVDYEVKKNKRSKGIKISINSNGVVSVTIPYLLPEILAHKFVKEKAGWVMQKIQEVNMQEKVILPTMSRDEYGKYRLQAYELIIRKLEKYNKHYRFFYNRVCIRDQKTRWGSCSSNKNLNFNYKLLFLPDHLVDYIVVHELCHLQEMNHSRDFWCLVEQSIEKYRENKNELKKIRIM
ncbi:M48 family metallopeptidase [Patescibacteria group bacterium]|nr:M48 family metallopeptidase [Patescibacteria group bacterium]